MARLGSFDPELRDIVAFDRVVVVEGWYDDDLIGEGGSSTPISVTDSGAGADSASTTATLTASDSGVGADSAVINATLSSTDSGAGADTATIALPITDAGSGADSASTSATLSPTDTGSGSESAEIGLSPSDTGSGADTGTVAAQIGGTDSGSGSETGVIGLPISDSGAGVDQAIIDAINSIADSGAGTESATIAPQAADTGSGSDSVSSSATISATDAGSGSESAIIGIPVTDSGSGSDSATVDAGSSESKSAADSGSGSDSASTSATLAAGDSGVGAESSQIGLGPGESGSGSDSAAIAVSAVDAGAGADSSGIAQTIADSGAGADSAQIASTLTATDAGTGVDVGSLPPSDTGLEAFWKLRERTLRQRFDFIGSAHLTPTGDVTKVIGRYGYAAQFNLPGPSYLATSHQSALRGGERPFTIAGWIQINSGAINHGVLGKHLNAAVGDYRVFINTLNQPVWQVFAVSGGLLVNVGEIIGSALSVGVPYFLAVAHDPTGNRVGMSINGADFTWAARTGAAAESAADFVMGRNIAAGLQMNGWLDAWGIYNRVWNDSDRQARYAGGIGWQPDDTHLFLGRTGGIADRSLTGAIVERT